MASPYVFWGCQERRGTSPILWTRTCSKVSGVTKSLRQTWKRRKAMQTTGLGQDRVNYGLFIRSIDPEVTQLEKRKLCWHVLRELDVNDK